MTLTLAARGSYDYDNQVLQFAGQEWVRVGRLDPTFGMSERAIRKLYERNAEAFSANETRLIDLPTEGGVQTTRVFSRSGVRLLAMLAHTPEAAALRIAFAQGRDAIFSGKVGQSPQLSLPGTHRLPSDTVRVLDEVAALIEPDHPAQAAIQGFRDGSRALSADPTIDRLVSRLEEGRILMGNANQRYSEVRREAERYGYSLEFIKAEAQRRRKDAA